MDSWQSILGLISVTLFACNVADCGFRFEGDDLIYGRPLVGIVDCDD